MEKVEKYITYLIVNIKKCSIYMLMCWLRELSFKSFFMVLCFESNVLILSSLCFSLYTPTK